MAATTARFADNTRATSYNAGVEAGVNLGISGGHQLTPRAGLRFSTSRLGGYSEAGSEAALTVNGISEHRFEARAGFALRGETGLRSGWSFRPNIAVDHVRALQQSSGAYTVRFALAPDVPIRLDGAGNDTSWTEVRGGVSLERGPVRLGAAVESDIGRSDRQDHRAVASLGISF